MIVRPIRYYNDNFCYLIRAVQDVAYTLVDPGDNQFILQQIKQNNLPIERILLTHRHMDHIGTNFEGFFSGLTSYLTEKTGTEPNLEVFAGADENMNFVNHPLHKTSESEEFDFGNWTMKTFHSPCHTRGHVLYYIQAKQQAEERDFTSENKLDCQFNKILLTGDTVFISGLGKFFEGTPNEMAKNVDYVSSLSGDTQIFPGHDYLFSNLKFCTAIDKTRLDVYESYIQKMKNREAAGIHLLPSSVDQEKSTNIFFRYKEQVLKDALGVSDDVESLGTLREWKDVGRSL